jgi:hypothetical protein
MIAVHTLCTLSTSKGVHWGDNEEEGKRREKALSLSLSKGELSVRGVGQRSARRLSCQRGRDGRGGW